VKALISAGDKVIVAVAPDKGDAKQGAIRLYAAADGKPLGEIPLPAAPAFDGLAAVEGALYVSLSRGAVVCLRAAK